MNSTKIAAMATNARAWPSRRGERTAGVVLVRSVTVVDGVIGLLTVTRADPGFSCRHARRRAWLTRQVCLAG
ncbi:hypothetical protein GCM10009818_23190 [Nakamurella flavida]